MKKYAVNRLCPLSDETHARVLAYIPAKIVAAENPTYRPNFSELLDISPEDEFPIVQSASGFVFSGWLPPNEFLQRVYEDVIDHSKTITETLGYRRSLLEFAGAFLQAAALYLTSCNRPLRLLDFGCGYGSLLRMLASRDIQSFGYEPSAKRIQCATDGPYQILTRLEDVEQAGPFDLVICTEVLEHVPNPRQALAFLKRNTRLGAILAITVPDCEQRYIYDCLSSLRTDQRLPPVFNPWEHLNYFSASTLRRLLAEEGFVVLNDFGRTKGARDACAYFGNSPRYSGVINYLRIVKRTLSSPMSTELFCQTI